MRIAVSDKLIDSRPFLGRIICILLHDHVSHERLADKCGLGDLDALRLPDRRMVARFHEHDHAPLSLFGVVERILHAVASFNVADMDVRYVMTVDELVLDLVDVERVTPRLFNVAAATALVCSFECVFSHII